MGCFCASCLRMLSLNPLPFCPLPRFTWFAFRREIVVLSLGQGFIFKTQSSSILLVADSPSLSLPLSPAPALLEVVMLPFTQEFYRHLLFLSV